MLKKKSIIAAIVAIVLSVCFILSCGSKDEDIPPVPQNTQTFITIVEKIETPITVESGYYIQAAFLVYEVLSEEEKANEDVIAKKATLDQYKTTYETVKAEADAEAARLAEQKRKDKFVAAVEELSRVDLTFNSRKDVDDVYALYVALKTESQSDAKVATAFTKLAALDAAVAELEKAEHRRIVKQKAEKFIAAVAETVEAAADDLVEPDEDILQNTANNKENQKVYDAWLKTIDNYGTVYDDLFFDYDDFDDEVLAYESDDEDSAYSSVEKAKAALDEAYDEYTVLRNKSDARDFLKQVAALGESDDVTLDSEGGIVKAEKLYRDMSDEAQAASGVAEAKAKLNTLREKFNEIFQADQLERAADFIAAVAEINDDTSTLDITWYDVLHNASVAYGKLAYETTQREDVEEAFVKWNNAQTLFNKKGYKQLTIGSNRLEFSGTTPPQLVIQEYAQMKNGVLALYGEESLSDLSGKLIVRLNVYTKNADGSYELVGRGALDATVLNTNMIDIPVIQAALGMAADGNDKLVSGGVYGFSLSFEDADNEFIHSAETDIVYAAGKVYTW